jgi:hypothetical protein
VVVDERNAMIENEERMKFIVFVCGDWFARDEKTILFEC